MKEFQHKAVTLYTLILLAVFPLFMLHTYYDIQEAKMYLYLYATFVCTAVVLICGIGSMFRDPAGPGAFFKNILKRNQRFRAADLFALLFFVTIQISTFSSEWVYESFWGNMARFQGGFLWSWYIVTYFLVSRYYRPKQWHLDLFLAGGTVVCGWAVLDYFSLSPIGVGYETLFSSTIGNINILTAVEAMYVAAASVLFLGEGFRTRTKRIRSICYLAAAVVCFMGLECGRTANGLLSAMFLFSFLPFFAFRNREGTARLFLLLGGFLGGMAIVAFLTAAFPGHAPTPDYWGELGTIGNRHGTAFAAAAAVLLICGAVFCRITAGQKRDSRGTESALTDVYGLTEEDRRFSRKLRTVWAVLGAAAFLAAVFVFYDANTGGHPELYAPYAKFLVFDEKWGTDRGYVWRLAFKYYRGFSPFKKLFGSGPETFSVYVLIYDLEANLRKFDLNYDSIHNEWIQHLFETGVLGFAGYYGMNLSAILEGFRAENASGEVRQSRKAKQVRKANENNHLIGVAFAFAVLVYLVQSFVNISVPIVLPLAMVCMSAAAAAGRIEEQ